MVTKEQNALFYNHARAQYRDANNRSSNYVQRIDCPTGYFCVHLNFPSLDYAQWILEEKCCLLDPEDPQITVFSSDIIDFNTISEKARHRYLAERSVKNYLDLCEYELLRDIHGPPPPPSSSSLQPKKSSLFEYNLIQFLKLKQELEYPIDHLVKVNPHLIDNLLPKYPIDNHIRCRIANGNMECTAIFSEERLLRLCLQSGKTTKWETIKYLFPFIYCLTKPWSNCCPSCSHSRRCPNVYVRSFTQEDVQFLFNLMSSYLRSDSFVREYRQKKKKSYGGSIAPTTDYDLLDYFVRILKVIHVRLNRCGSQGIESAIDDRFGSGGFESKRLSKTIFNEMQPNWWKEILEYQLVHGTPEALSWIYETNEAFSDWATNEDGYWLDNVGGGGGNTFDRQKEDCRVFRNCHRHIKKIPKWNEKVGIINKVLNNTNAGVFAAFVKGEYANSRVYREKKRGKPYNKREEGKKKKSCNVDSVVRKNRKISNNRKSRCKDRKSRFIDLHMAEFYTTQLIAHNRLEECYIIFDLYLKRYEKEPGAIFPEPLLEKEKGSIASDQSLQMLHSNDNEKVEEEEEDQKEDNDNDNDDDDDNYDDWENDWSYDKEELSCNDGEGPLYKRYMTLVMDQAKNEEKEISFKSLKNFYKPIRRCDFNTPKFNPKINVH